MSTQTSRVTEKEARTMYLENFIGIYGGDYNSISECISYNDWIKNLLSQTVIEQFDN